MTAADPCAYPRTGLGAGYAYALVGPTAIGKTAVAAMLAREDGLALLSADSMGVYRGMSVGTAKPVAMERPPWGVFGIDLAEPFQEFSAGEFLEHAGMAARAAAAAGRPLAIVGGTGLYIKALIGGLEETSRPSAMVREVVRLIYEKEGTQGLQSALREEAPEHWASLEDPSNPRRLMRALERARMGLAPPRDWAGKPPPTATLVGLEMERSALRQRIYERVQRMYAEGLLDEAALLRQAPGGLSETARQAIGYAEAFGCLDGTWTREEAIYRTVVRTSQLAKRQMTFFRNQLPVQWLPVQREESVAEVAKRVRDAWRRLGPTSLRLPAPRAPASGSGDEGRHVYPTMKKLPVEQRPREAFAQKGAEGMTDEGLLAILLRTGAQGVNAVDLASNLMEHYLNLTQMARASVDDLATFRGVGRTKAQILKAALEVGRRLAQESLDQRPEARTPEQAARILRPLIQSAEQEHFWVLVLDTRYRLLRAPVEVSKGILDASLVHPREVFREAIRASARAVILAHNHPSGDVSPSTEDLRITRQLLDAGRILDIEVLDHLVLGRAGAAQAPDYLSLRETGLVSFDP